MKSIIKKLEGRKLLMVGVGFAVFLSGINLLIKDLPPPQAYMVGAGFILLGAFVINKFEK